MNKIKAVIFDMDGVLIDSEVVTKKCFKQACDEFGVIFDENFYLSLVGLTYKESDKLCEDHFGVELYEKFSNRWGDLYDEASVNGLMKLKKDCKEILEYLVDNRIPYALATSSPYMNVENAFLNQGYDRVPFEYVMTGDKVVNSKPDPEIFVKASKLMNIDIKECMIIEDSYNGIMAAYRSKGVPVLVPDVIEASNEMCEMADYVCSDLFEVMDLLKKLIL